MKAKHSHIVHKYINGEIDFSELKNQLPEEEFMFWKDTLELVDEFPKSDFDTEAEFEKLIQKRNQATKKSTRYAKYLNIAAAVIVLLTSAFLIDLYVNKNTQPTTIVYNAELTENIIVLPDSSKVYLNQGATVSYNAQQWEEERTLTLNGEAYFDVEEGKNFSVKTTLGLVEVLGTTFNVYDNAKAFKVTCYTGKVRVNNNTKNIVLTPGQSYNNSKDEVISVEAKKPQWLNKQSLFEAVPLVEVVKDIENNKNIRIDLKLDQSYTFTGGYQHQQKPEDILKLISESLGINFIKVADNHFQLVNL